MRKLIEASHAVAISAKMCRPAVIPVYPITPQTHIVEHLSDFVNNGGMNAEMIHSESEHSALSSAIGAQATGVRTFTATASQGLALMHEILFVASGLRLPIVMAVANRALSAPINIWCDNQDSISERDSGWIQIYVESAQEAFDAIIQAYMIAESEKILLPVMVCMDGYSLSHVYEEVDMPEQAAVDKFLPAYAPDTFLNPEKPVTIGPIAFPNTYMEFKLEQQKAMEISKAVIKKTNSEFRDSFGRSYGDGLIEAFNMKGAEYAIIAMGSVCGTIKSMADELKKKKTGLMRVRAFRPFPKNELISACRNLKAVAVIDRNISLGQEGALLSEVKSLLFNEKKRPLVKGFIAGLGGREIKPGHISKITENLKSKGEKTEWLL